MKIGTLLARAGLATVALSAITAHAALVYTPIAFTGTTGPLGPGISGVTFSNVSSVFARQGASVNSAGQATFRGITSAGTVQGVYRYSGGSNTNVAIEGGAIPGGGTYGISGGNSFGAPVMNSGGDYAFRVTNPSSGAVASVGGTASRVLMPGDIANGAGGAAYSASTTPLFNNSAQVAFVGTLSNSTTSVPPTTSTAPTANNTGLWMGQPGSLGLVVRQNDTIAAIDPTGTSARLGSFNANTIAFNHLGKFLSTANLQGSGVVTGTGATGNSVALLSNRNNVIEKIARVGDAAPTTSGTDLYRSFSALNTGFNNAGHVVFQGTLRDAAGTQTSAGSIFTDAGNGVLREIARASAPLPTISGALGAEFTGVTWGTPGNSPVVSGNDVLAFTTTLTGAPAGTTNMLLTMQRVSGVDTYTRIARSGDAIATNVLINSFNPVGGTGINALGQLCFQASLTGTGVTSGVNDQALFGWDPVAGLIVIARTGDVMSTPFGTKTIASFGLLNPLATGNEDGRVSSMADNGVLAFPVVFTDLSEAIYMTTIPTPGSLALLGLGGLVATRRRR